MLLYFKGGTVHLVCRSAERGKEAQEAIIKETKNDVRFQGISLILSAQKILYNLESTSPPCGHVPT